MPSALALSLGSLKSAAAAAHATVLAGGQQAAGQVVPDFSSMSGAEQKRHLEGALFTEPLHGLYLGL